jgi:hypothetical protein
LPRQQERHNPGILRLVDGAGTELLICECLGKADGKAASAAGNPSRDPVLENGDTPTGLYAPARALLIPPADPNFAHMGAWFIPLIGVSGDAARAKNAGRKGLALHAGRGDDRLVPTHGCLRVRDGDMAELVDTLNGRLVDEIAIDEKPQGA